MSGLTDPGFALYVAAAVALVVWLGIFAYLWKIDAHAKALRRTLESRRDQSAQPSTPAVRPERVAAERKESHHV